MSQHADVEVAHGGRGDRLTRRGLLGAGVVTAGAAVIASCSDDGPPVAAPGEITSVRIDTVPLDPRSTRWNSTPETTVVMDGQMMALPFRAEPVVPEIRVRSLHDATVLAFRIEWDDPDADESTVRVDAFRDACAVLLGEPGMGDDLRLMGTLASPATLLHWKADWQNDVDNGITSIDDEFPNRSIDAYPPLIRTEPLQVTPQDYVDQDATEWLPGMHVGNVLSAPVRPTSVEKTIAYGFRTTTTAPTQDARGRGEHGKHGWSVVLTKPLRAADPGEIGITNNGATCAFAVWSGAANDSGGKKSPSLHTYRLVLRQRSVPSPFPS